ncbi:MAG: hypothetical protein JWO05_3295 [Gemmatimonadetes bacterium]|nr:hypothetical protein [Gemmatimonadota bacterium]
MLGALALASPLSRARAQGGVSLQGIVDLEGWSTDSASSLLVRNAGKPGALARLDLWTALQPGKGFVLFGEMQVEGGNARAEAEKFELYFEHYGVRWSPSSRLVVDAGKMPYPMGTFAARRFSNRNPLIGAPDGYPLQYPYGLQVAGEANRLDWHAAVVSMPVFHEGYAPDPSPRARPVVGVGITPVTGFRVGVSFTQGSYLSHDLQPAQLNGRAWSDYSQQLVAGELLFERGYSETHAEVGHVRNQVPFKPDITGLNWYVESRYAFGPRVFGAVRVERNDYPFIAAFGGPAWTARRTDFVNGEVGGGYRFTAATLVKLSVRADRWWLEPDQREFRLPGGYAVAMQLSHSFDVMDWVGKP